VEANGTGVQGSHRAVVPSDDDDDTCINLIVARTSCCSYPNHSSGFLAVGTVQSSNTVIEPHTVRSLVYSLLSLKVATHLIGPVVSD
jgi:hypothetical protein